MKFSLGAEPLFSIGSLLVTNSMLTGWIVTVGFIALAVALRRPKTGVPGRLQNFFEAILESMLNFADQVTGSRQKSQRFLPIVGSLFLFILASNWFGLIPGVSSIVVNMLVHGEIEAIPLLRPATSDLNTTLAMAAFSVTASHVVGIASLGFFSHWNKFIQLGGLWNAVAGIAKYSIKETLVNLLTAVIGVFVGLIELVSEVAKVVSLSLRLFGNVFAGEVLLGVIASLVSVAFPVPFMLLEFVVGIVQALVFSMLSLVYLTIASEAAHGSEAHEPAHQEPHAAPAHA